MGFQWPAKPTDTWLILCIMLPETGRWILLWGERCYPRVSEGWERWKQKSDPNAGSTYQCCFKQNRGNQSDCLCHFEERILNMCSLFLWQNYYSWVLFHSEMETYWQPWCGDHKRSGFVPCCLGLCCLLLSTFGTKHSPKLKPFELTMWMKERLKDC